MRHFVSRYLERVRFAAVQATRPSSHARTLLNNVREFVGNQLAAT